jgi:hypothetical protein
MERNRRREQRGAREKTYIGQSRPQLDKLLTEISSLESENREPETDNHRGADALESILLNRRQRSDTDRNRREPRGKESSRTEIPPRQISTREGGAHIRDTNSSISSSRRRNQSSRSTEAETLVTSSKSSPPIPSSSSQREKRNYDDGSRYRRYERSENGRSELSLRTTRTSRNSNSNPDRDIRPQNQRLRNRAGSITSKFSDFLSIATSLKIGGLFNDDFSEAATSYTNDSNVPDLSDNLTMNSLLVQSTADTEGFSILTPEKYLDQKKRLVQLTNSFESIQNKLSLEFKVKEATENVIKFNSENLPQLEEAKRQLIKSEKKMQDLSKGFFY